MKKFFLMVFAITLGVVSCYSQVVDFEELSLDSNSAWTGAVNVESFSSSYLTLYNDYEELYNSWQGFAYTNETDTQSSVWTNLSAATGSGADNSENYAVAYIGSDWMNSYTPIPIALKINTTFAGNFDGRGAYFCLAYQTKFYIENNYPAGSHWLKLKISAYENSAELATREVAFADFSNENSFVMDEWTYVDLSWIATADSLNFVMISSDIGEYGINTPAYFCMDNFGAEQPIVSIDSNSIDLFACFDSDFLHIKSNSIVENVKVFDILGRLQNSFSPNNSEVEEYINLNDGLYIVSIYTREGTIVKKLVK